VLAVTKVFPDTYRDSVELMRIAAEVERVGLRPQVCKQEAEPEDIGCSTATRARR